MATIDELIRKLDSPDENERAAAAEQLGKQRCLLVTEPLIDALQNDPSLAVRKAAAQALGENGDRRALQPLLETVNSDEEVDLRQTAGDPNAIDTLTEILFNPESGYTLRKTIVETLAKFRDSKAVQPILKVATDDADNSVAGAWLRTAAIEALAERREPEVIPVLVQAVKEKNATVQSRATKALRALVHIHPDIILRLSPEDRHLIERILQDEERNDFLRWLCGTLLP